MGFEGKNGPLPSEKKQKRKELVLKLAAAIAALTSQGIDANGFNFMTRSLEKKTVSQERLATREAPRAEASLEPPKKPRS